MTKRRKRDLKAQNAKGAPICGAVKSRGGTCEKPAGFGTSHPGSGACRQHGGEQPTHLAAAQAREAVLLGAPLDIDPWEALLWCVRLAAGEVSFMTGQVMKLQGSEFVVQDTTTISGGEGGTVTRTSSKAQLHIWIEARHDAMNRLTRYSQIAIAAGIAERQVALAERFGQQLAMVMRAIFDEIVLTPAQEKKAPAAVRRHLALLEGGTA